VTAITESERIPHGTVSRGGRSFTWNGAHVFHLRDGKVVEFWDASTDQYGYDEFLGRPGRNRYGRPARPG